MTLYLMTAFTRQNTVYDIDTSIARYTDISTINNGVCRCCCCCCCRVNNHNHNGLPHQHDDHQIEDSPSSSVTEHSLSTPSRRKEIRVNISPASCSGSASFLQHNHEGQERRACSCRKDEVKKKEQRKDGEKNDKEKEMKLKRLVVLLAVFILYVSLGAVVFNALEAGAEQDRRDELDDYIRQFLEKNPCVNRSDLYGLLRKAVVDSEIVFYVVENKTHLDRWDFSGSFGFVVSVVTTIGFGNLSPFTMEGKAVCVVYAMFGIPLTLLLLGGLGEKMARCISRMRKCKNPMCHHTPRGP